MGVLRTGVWYDCAKGFRYPFPSDPRNWIDVSAPNFIETYQTTTVQPYLEYEFHVTPALRITPLDAVSGEPMYFLNDKEISRGVEAEGTVLVGKGFSVYANATVGTTKYETDKWVAGAPADTKTLGLNDQHNGWDAGLFVKCVGKVYADNGATHEAFGIDPVTLANLCINYRVKNPMLCAKQAKLQLPSTTCWTATVLSMSPRQAVIPAPAPPPRRPIC
jgi:hypothetical protein